MKINIYYGGRGLLDDPTLYVLNKMEEVLKELRVTVERINIYEHKNEIATLPQTMKDADGIILATTVEWLGIGGYMQQFLDACWLYGDKEKIKVTYMQPIVMSTTYGEREGEMTLANAWEILGGLPCAGLCGYVEDLVTFEMNEDYTVIIEKKAENLYRTISQKIKNLPTSNQAVKRSISRTPQLELNPQPQDAFMKDFQRHFTPQHDFAARYLFMIDGMKEPLFIAVKDDKLEISYGKQENIDVIAKLSDQVLESIVEGRMTFQRAFMTGEMTAKGNFKTLRMLDTMFNFV